jgi:hypothetical protein
MNQEWLTSSCMEGVWWVNGHREGGKTKKFFLMIFYQTGIGKNSDSGVKFADEKKKNSFRFFRTFQVISHSRRLGLSNESSSLWKKNTRRLGQR